MIEDSLHGKPDPGASNGTPLSDSFFRTAIPYWLLALCTLALALGLYGLSRHNYLLVHILIEISFVVVAFTVFSIGWNARKFFQHNALMTLAVAFLVVGAVELLHAISYRGMGIFPQAGTNTPTQLWIVSRYLTALSFIASAAVLGRKKPISPWLLLGVSFATGLTAVITIWPLDLFPDCYIEGVGLTPFKIVSEIIISTLLAFAILIFWKKREHLNHRVLKLLTAAILFSIAAELTFTLYQDVYGLTNFIGHFSLFLSIVLIYRTLVIGTLRSPYATLFRDLTLANSALDLELTQRRKTELELRTANRELDAFVRTVSHDLRTPLTPIVGLPDLLLDRLKDQLDESSIKALGDIRDQGLRMARILEDLLTFARAGRLVDGVAAARVDTVLQNVLEDFGSQIIESGLSVEVREMPEIEYPRTALFQIFSNLLSNAIKYAGSEGGPVIFDGQTDEQKLLLSIRDHGPGIPEDLREKIFDVFYRGSVAQEEPGSGIGLATVLKIARHLDGEAWVEETPGGGATFFIRLALPDQDRQQQLEFD